jgi:hypothetical protein
MKKSLISVLPFLLTCLPSFASSSQIQDTAIVDALHANQAQTQGALKSPS